MIVRCLLQWSSYKLVTAQTTCHVIPHMCHRLFSTTNSIESEHHVCAAGNIKTNPGLSETPSLNDAKLSQPKRKQKVMPRMPYRVYNSSEGIVIRVGRTAHDNDLLSMDPLYRVDDYWWLHVAGHPGSHVVVCLPGVSAHSLATVHKETLIDAALLAVLNSSVYPKSPSKGAITATVHYTKCGNISKAPRDVAGLVRLGGGFVGTISINTGRYRERAQRLADNAQPLNYNDLVIPT